MVEPLPPAESWPDGSSHGVHSCPAFLGCYHESLGTLCYTNAGHTPGLLRDRTGIAELNSTGLPLGLFSHATCDAPTVGVMKGAVLLLVSRGVVEGKCKDAEVDDQEFGLERVKEFLRAEDSSNTETLAASLLNAVGEFVCEPTVPGRHDRTDSRRGVLSSATCLDPPYLKLEISPVYAVP